MEVRLSTTANDFIAPSLACIKPVQVDQTKKKRVLQLEGVEDAGPSTAAPQVPKVTLNDCLACSGCITSSETVLVQQQSISEFERMLAAGPSTYDMVVVSLSAAARAAIAVHLGLGLRDTHARLTGFLKAIGCHRVLDCGLAADLHLVQTAAEFIHRFRAQATAATGGAEVAPPPAAAATAIAAALPLPLLTSSCPGWVCYAEKMQGDAVLRHLSRVKVSGRRQR